MILDKYTARQMIRAYSYARVEIELEINVLRNEMILELVKGPDVDYNRNHIKIGERQLDFIAAKLIELGDIAK